MSNKQLLSYSLISLILFLLLLSLSACNNSNQTAINAQHEELETYEYIVTSVDKEGIHGQSLTDDTGIFITHEVAGINLDKDDQIKVSFPKNDYETITKVTKIN